jgi:hypothetical protein
MHNYKIAKNLPPISLHHGNYLQQVVGHFSKVRAWVGFFYCLEIEK